MAQYAFTDAEIEKAVLYRTLRRLEQNGYVTSDWDVEEPGPARRVYTLTKDGQAHLREWGQVLTKVAGSMTRFVRRVASDKSLELKNARNTSTRDPKPCAKSRSQVRALLECSNEPQVGLCCAQPS